MMKKPNPDRFAAGETIAAETAPPSPAPAPVKAKAKPRVKKTILSEPTKRSAPENVVQLPSPTPKRPGVRPPNVSYDRDGRIYVKCPKSLCRALDRAVLAEKEKREPVPMDKGIAVEEAVRMWLKANGYKSE